MTETGARILLLLLIAGVALAARYLPWVDFFFTRRHIMFLFILVMGISLCFGLLVPKALTGNYFPPMKSLQELSSMADKSAQQDQELKSEVADLKGQVADLKGQIAGLKQEMVKPPAADK